MNLSVLRRETHLSSQSPREDVLQRTLDGSGDGLFKRANTMSMKSLAVRVKIWNLWKFFKHLPSNLTFFVFKSFPFNSNFEISCDLGSELLNEKANDSSYCLGFWSEKRHLQTAAHPQQHGCILRRGLKSRELLIFFCNYFWWLSSFLICLVGFCILALWWSSMFCCPWSQKT